jgi:hypothetical protein
MREPPDRSQTPSSAKKKKTPTANGVFLLISQSVYFFPKRLSGFRSPLPPVFTTHAAVFVTILSGAKVLIVLYQHADAGIGFPHNLLLLFQKAFS